MKPTPGKQKLVIAFVILLGISLLAYPYISKFLFARGASDAISDYDSIIEQANPEELERAWQAAISYNESLEGNPVKDPFLIDSGMVMAENYLQVLNLSGTGVMGYINVPKIGVLLSIHHGTADYVLEKGIGHLEGSSLPIGGAGCHSVLTGHSGLAHAKMFTDLEKLQKGDIFYLHLLDQVLAYEVDQIKIVLPEEITDLARIPNEDHCTLITCHPYLLNTHRLLVRGVRTEYNPEQASQYIADNRPSLQWFTGWNVFWGVAVGLALALIIIFVFSHTHRKKARERKRYWWDEIHITNPSGNAPPASGDGLPPWWQS